MFTRTRTRLAAALVAAALVLGSATGLLLARADAPPTAGPSPPASPAAGVVPGLAAPAPADTPKADTPKADTPKADTPKADTPKAEPGKAGGPKADALRTDAPKADAPAGDAARTDGLKLPPELKVDPSELYVTLVAETTADDVRWIVVASVPVKFTPLGRTLVVAVPPGATIYVHAYGTVGGKATPPARTVITVGTVAGGPVVAPPPAAKSGVHVTVVEDPAARADHPWLGDLLNDRELRAELARRGHTFRVVAATDPEIERAKLRPFIEAAGGTPCLIVQGRDGTVHAPQTLPRTAAGVLAAVRAATPPAAPPE